MDPFWLAPNAAVITSKLFRTWSDNYPQVAAQIPRSFLRELKEQTCIKTLVRNETSRQILIRCFFSYIDFMGLHSLYIGPLASVNFTPDPLNEPSWPPEIWLFWTSFGCMSQSLMFFFTLATLPFLTLSLLLSSSLQRRREMMQRKRTSTHVFTKWNNKWILAHWCIHFKETLVSQMSQLHNRCTYTEQWLQTK